MGLLFVRACAGILRDKRPLDASCFCCLFFFFLTRETQTRPINPLPPPNSARDTAAVSREELGVNLLPDASEEVIVQQAALGTQLVATPCAQVHCQQ